jgi:hypothetical protein
MQSKIIAMLVPEDRLEATMLVRRANGQFAFERIDARVAAASRVAAGWASKGISVVNLAASDDIDVQMADEVAA